MLTDIQLERSYNAKRAGTNVVRDFFVPALSEARSYDRLTFAFSSGALSAAARGVAGLVANEGRMRILAAPELSEADQAAIFGATEESRTRHFETLALKSIEGLEELTDKIRRNYVSALSWMLASGRLDLKFAFSVNLSGTMSSQEGIFHPKLGVIRDKDGNGVSFSGSINETLSGWTRNVEHFKVFKSWLESDTEHFNDDADTFSSYWYSPGENGIQFVDIKDPLERTLVKSAPEEFPHNVLVEFEAMPVRNAESTPLRDYQKMAIDTWAESGFRGILQMATGSGKTFTAANAVDLIRRELGPVNVFVIAPDQTIASQWKEALEDKEPLLLTEFGNWAQRLEIQLNDVILGLRPYATIISVVNRSSQPKFLSKVEKLKSAGKKTLLIADEVHNFGAETFRKALDENYDYRLGLSATPVRPFDEEGTEVILSFFGGSIFEFGIQQALDWTPPPGQTPILCEFDYFPVWVRLTEDEADEYRRLSLRVARSFHARKASDSRGSLAANERAKVLKKASNKIPALKKELEARMPVQKALVYCQDGQQVREVRRIAQELQIKDAVFSGALDDKPEDRFDGLSERESLLKDFTEGRVDMLIAMNMLDEGVNLPSAQLAFMLSSSGNEKEFIQRTGRVIRWSTQKDSAAIVDFLVDPEIEVSSISDSDRRRLAKLQLKEIRRVIEYAKPARNKIAVIMPILEIEASLIQISKDWE